MWVRPNGWYSAEDLGCKQGYSRIKGKHSFLLLVLLSFLSSTGVLGDEVTSLLKPESLKNNSYQPDQSGEFFSQLSKYVQRREAWGLIDEVHYIEEQTAEVTAHRLGNRFLLRTPFGGFLWGYQKAWGEASIFPRRNNVFGGRLQKQPFVSGSEDKRSYGYFIDTKRYRRWLGEEGLPFGQSLDVQGHFIYTNSAASVGRRPRVNFASESFESVETGLSAYVNRGRWFGLGSDFFFIRYNPVSFGRFTVFDQKEIIDRDVWHGRITSPVFENFHISGLYDEDDDGHRFVNTNIASVGGIPALLVPNRSVRSTQRKYGPEVKYFFGKDLQEAVSFGFYHYDGESAGRLAEFGLKRAFRIDSAGQFRSLELHNSFGLAIGYDEYEERVARNQEKRKKWGLLFESGYLESDSVSRPFSGTIFLLRLPSGAPFMRPTTAVRQFDENLRSLFFKFNFIYHYDPKGDEPHPIAGELHADVSLWDIERKGKQSQKFPLLGTEEVIPTFRDDRRILQIETNYELDKPRHRFWGVHSVTLDFNWDTRTSDKVGGISVGFFY